MQGWSTPISTERKIRYLNALLKVGFDTLDFGSFVSPKAIPQMADTAAVLEKLDLSNSYTRLLAIIANLRGAEEAAQRDAIHYLGFPFSISETFQLKNTNSSIEESLRTVEQIQTLCARTGKELVVYISMGFGNPYGDPYNADTAIQWVGRLAEMGITIFSMSDTVGVSNPSIIEYIFSNLTQAFPQLEFGAHFHSTAETRQEKLSAAFDNGCFRFDSAIMGIGGCPMAQDDLVGNMATEDLIRFMADRKLSHHLNGNALAEATIIANEVLLPHG
jgi:hydroxymethylglutaryl-CoA lyase